MEQAVTISEKIFDTGEMTIHYAEVANNGTPMVLLHGATRWWHDWDAVMKRLQNDWHLYACDLRGHGQSGRDGVNYLLTDYVRDIVTFLDFQMDEPVVLVGHSLGALTAIGAAAQAPDRVKALVLLDPPLFLRNSSIATAPGIQFWLNLVGDLKRENPAFDDLLDKVRNMANIDDEAEIRSRAEVMYQLAAETLDVQLRDELLDGFDVAEELGRISCPTLVIQADAKMGGVMRDEDADFFRAHVRGVEVIKLADTGHGLPDQHTDEVVAVMGEFLG